MSGLLDGRIAMAMTPMRAGWPGIDSALSAMQVNVETAMRDPRVRQAAVEIIHNGRARGGDRRAEAEVLFDFVLRRVDYRRDPAWLEFIQDPRVLLAHIEATEKREGPGRGWAAGDCDDHAQLIAVLGFQVRLPIVLVLVAESDRPFSLSADELLTEFKLAEAAGRPVPIHVYAAMREGRYAEPSREWLEGDDGAPSGLVSLDTARPGASFGEHAKGVVRYVRPAVLED